MSLPSTDRSDLPPAWEVIEGIGVRWPIPPFLARRVATENRRSVRERPVAERQVDAALELEWDGWTERFAVEYKSAGTPLQVDGAILQLRRFLVATPSTRPLVVAPFLKNELLDRLVSEGVSGIDLCGNMAITVPGRWLVVRSGAPNRFPASGTIKNVYRGRSSLIARALMLRGSYPSATAIANELGASDGVTLPTVSKVLASLEDELIVTRTAGIRVVQPDGLLDNLLANYQPPVARRSVRGKVSRTPALMERLRENADGAGIAYAVDAPERYTVLPSSDPVQRIYTRSIDALLRDVPVDAASRFPDVEVVETDDAAVFYRRVWGDGTFWMSPLQVYLQLATGGKREQQAALPIRADLLAFKYQ